jgi:hypothetical protein
MRPGRHANDRRGSASPSHPRPQFLTVAIRSVRRSLSLRLNPETWGGFGENAVWLAPEPYDGFDAFVSVVWSAFPDYQPYADAFADVVPHLTIGAHCGPRLLRATGHAVATSLPITASIRTAHVFAGSDAPVRGAAAPSCLWVHQAEVRTVRPQEARDEAWEERASAKREGHLPRSAIVPSLRTVAGPRGAAPLQHRRVHLEHRPARAVRYRIDLLSITNKSEPCTAFSRGEGDVVRTRRQHAGSKVFRGGAWRGMDSFPPTIRRPFWPPPGRSITARARIEIGVFRAPVVSRERRTGRVGPR